MRLRNNAHACCTRPIQPNPCARNVSISRIRIPFSTKSIPWDTKLLRDPPIWRASSSDSRQEGTSSTFQRREQGIQSQLEALKSMSRDAYELALSEAQRVSSEIYMSGDGEPTSTTQSLRQRLETAIEEMSEGLVERDAEVRLLLLAALAGEHILFIGPPGTAKSELGRRLSRLCHGVYFERLLTRFSVPEELFGPLSMRALEEDTYIRQTAGYLPEATVAFIDEIFKANSAILNTLLTLLNERLFDNGAKRAPVPLLCLVGASNELPESEELDALYDRFLLRRRVSQVSPSGLLEMLGSSRSSRRGQALANALAHPGLTAETGESDESAAPLLSADDFYTTRWRAEQSVSVPPSVLNIIADLRSFLQDKCEPPVYVSDRRLVKAVGMMQVAAYTSGRNVVSEFDCLLLQHVLWQRPDEADRIYDWLLNTMAADDGLQQMQYLLASMFGRGCHCLGNDSKMKTLADEVSQLRETLVGKLAAVYSSTVGGPAENLWLGRDEAEAVGSALLPKLEKTAKEVETLLFEVVTLETALREQAGAVEVAQLLPERWAQFLREGLVVAMRQRTEPVVLAELMPRHWSEFVRNAPLDQVKPLGTQSTRD